MMNLMSPSGFFISLMASLAAMPFFLFTLPAGALADALNESRILRLTNLWLAGSAGALALLGWIGMLNPMLLLGGVFLLGVGFAINAPAWASVVPQIVTDGELPSASALTGVQLNISGIHFRSKRAWFSVGFRSGSYPSKNWLGPGPSVEDVCVFNLRRILLHRPDPKRAKYHSSKRDLQFFHCSHPGADAGVTPERAPAGWIVAWACLC
jgi:hypothetical protein